MRVKIKAGGFNISLPLPTGLLFNRLSAGIATKVVNRYANCNAPAGLSYADMRRFMQAYKLCRKNFAGHPLLSAHTAEGEIIEILL